MEFWQGDWKRKHTRLVHRRKAGTELWTKGLLWL
ncbi:pyridoxine 5'-phosphate oxidase C-terminal domain-containing protein [Streptomyces natalensis]